MILSPALDPPLIGRAHELAELRRLVRRGGTRLTTLTGPGGTGKSRLAVALAAEIAAEFPGGVWLVDLTAIRDAQLLLTAIAQTMGVQESGNQTLSEVVHVALGKQPILLVLDNFEHVLEAAESVTELLATCPDLVVLVTSREPLGLRSEHVFSVSPLDLPDLAGPRDLSNVATSIALFADRAAARRHDFVLTDDNYPTVAEICLRLDGLPLAIELAAAQVAVLSPQSVLHRLRERAPFVVSGPRDLPARHKTLEAAVAWSYELLSGSEQDVFGWCSVFIGGCTVEAVEVVSDGSRRGIDVPTALAQLATKSLIQLQDQGDDEPRVRVLETIRAYAGEQLRDAGQSERARHRHAEYYVELAERHQHGLRGPDLATTLSQLAREYDNFRAIFTWCAETANQELGLRLAGALYRFWYLRGPLAEPRQWLDAALERVEHIQPEIHATALHAAGVLAGVQHDDARATELFEASLAIWTALDDVHHMARTTNNLGLLAHNQGNLDRAEDLYRRAELLFERTGDRWGLSSAVGAQARLATEQHNAEKAMPLFDRSLALTREVGDDWATANELANLGKLLLDQRDARRSAECFREALELRRSVGNVLGITECLEGFASVAAERQPRRAAQLVSAASALRAGARAVLPRTERDLHEHTLERVRARLTHESFAAAWASGQTLTLHAAVELALGGDDHEPAPVPGGASTILSPREVEVAQLIAQGRSNREIAEALVVSSKTIESHVKHIFEKLGVQARAEVAVWATRQGLVAEQFD